MSDKASRLREARKAQGYATASAGAFAVGVSTPTYIHHENGTRDYDADAAVLYAKYFNTTPGWLMFGDNEEQEVQPAPVPLPVTSLVGMFFVRDSGEYFVTGQIISEIKDGVYLLTTEGAPSDNVTRPFEIMSIEDMLGFNEMRMPVMALFRTRAEVDAWVKWISAPEKPSVVNLVKPPK